ncbi:PH domain-containing protein [Nafulsella turpanensis]|uniref:PH domain-containing protein n=1 Tax=Nafulsella turpanensis TaxID=1265690 RepID=UPI003898F14F
MWFGTWYRISDGKLYTRSVPAASTIPIAKIRKIEKGRTLWSGWIPEGLLFITIPMMRFT